MRCFGQHQYLAVGLLLALLPPKILFTLDCNGNGKDDNLDIQVGTSTDCNKNGIPDECDVRPSGISFLPPKGYPFVKGVGTPAAVAAADFDGDGDIDVVVMNRGWKSTQFSAILLALNLGDGSLGSPQLITVGLFPWAIAVGDFDGDGDPDLVVSFFESDSILSGVSLFLNRGDATFAKPVKYRTPQDLTSMIARDLDGDQDLDLVGVSRFSNTAFSNTACFVLRNGGGGTFEPAESLSIGPAFSRYPEQAAVEDFNGDGLLDILVDYCDFGGLSLFTNDNQGGFQLQDPIMLNPQLCGLLAADFDGDAIADLASGDTLILNRGNGTFFDGVALGSSGLGSVADLAVDMNADGRLDILVKFEEGLSVLINRGRGEFDPPLLIVGSKGFRAEAADLNGDRHQDLLLWADSCETVSVLLQGTELTPRSQDKDRDGIPDECESDCNRNGSPDGFDVDSGLSADCNKNGIPDECDTAPRLDFSPPEVLLEGLSWISVPLIADLNGDGLDDLAVGSHTDGEVVMVYNQSNGVVSDPLHLSVGDRVDSLAAGDVDGDGDLDLVVAGQRGGVILRNNANRGFSKLSNILLSPANINGVADLNADGMPDLLYTSWIDDVPKVFMIPGKGDGTFLPPRALFDGDATNTLDLDGDGDIDVVLEEKVTFPNSSLALYFNNGSGRFAEKSNWPGRLLAPADIDGDGDLDLVVWRPACGESLALRNRGDGTLEESPVIATSGLWNAIAVDVDLDGDVDMVSVDSSSTLRVFPNNGRGQFEPPTKVFVQTTGLFNVVAANWDGDGKVDLVCTAFSIVNPWQLFVLRNRTEASPSKDENRDGVPDECPPPGGRQLPADATQDSRLNISDAIWLLSHLFLGAGTRLPCEGGTAGTPGPGELSLLDPNGDGAINLADVVAILGWLFLDRAPPVLGVECRIIPGCPEACRGK